MDGEEKILIDKYEINLYNRESMYFDATEFDIIISHYIYGEQYFDAMEALIHAKLCHPENMDLDLFKIEILIRMEEYEKAVKLIAKLEGLFNDYFEIDLFRGQIFLAMDNIADAVFHFDEAVRKNEADFNDNDYEPGIYDIPELLINKSCYKEALAVLEKLNGVNGENVEVLCQIAYCHENISEAAEAEKYYEKALDINPFDEKTWISLGLLCIDNANYEKALNAFDFALAINCDNYSASLYKANTLMIAKKHDEAIDWIRDSGYSAGDASFAYLLGKCYEEKADISKAMEYYTESIKHDPEFSLPYWSVSKILYAADNLQLAIKSIDKALEYDSENMEYIYLRGLCMIGLALGSLKFNALKEKIVNEKSASQNAETKENAQAEKIMLEKNLLEGHKLAALFYRLGDQENCCKCLLNSPDFTIDSLEAFFAQVPDAKDDSYIINYLGKYLK